MHAEPCRSGSCDERDLLSLPHLRIQVSPPGQPWKLLRFCDAICLLDWLADDEIRGEKRQVFVEDQWIDSHA